MAQSRKDNKGRMLLKGEMQRSEDLRYMYAYTDPYGKRCRIYANTLQELRKKEDALKKRQLDGLDIYVSGAADLNYVFDRYITTKTELRKTTYTNYVYMYDHFVRDTFGKRKVNEIKYSDVLYFYFDLLNKQNMQINTLETIHTVLHPTFELAVRDDIIRKNPSDGVMAEIKKKSNKTAGVRHALTLEQQRAFLSFVKESKVHWRWAPLFTVMLGTGCRVGEVVGLRWEDVDFESRTISINHSLTYYSRRTGESSKCEFDVSLPKTAAGIRVIPMMESVYEAFQEEHEWQEEHGFNTTTIGGMTGFIFGNRFGSVHNPQAINRAIRRITENHNTEEVVKAKKEKRQPVIIPHFSCHHLRHTFCTRFCENESNVKVIQAIMGHADITTTMNIYAEVTESTKTQAMTALSKSINIF